MATKRKPPTEIGPKFEQRSNGCGSELSHQGTAGFSPWFHLPGFHFGYPFWTHSHSQINDQGVRAKALGRGGATGDFGASIKCSESGRNTTKQVSWQEKKDQFDYLDHVESTYQS